MGAQEAGWVLNSIDSDGGKELDITLLQQVGGHFLVRSTPIASVFMDLHITQGSILLINYLTTRHKKKEINVNRVSLQQFACSTRLESINRKIISLETDIWKL